MVTQQYRTGSIDSSTIETADNDAAEWFLANLVIPVLGVLPGRRGARGQKRALESQARHFVYRTGSCADPGCEVPEKDTHATSSNSESGRVSSATSAN
jgi:hypothetical protein